MLSSINQSRSTLPVFDTVALHEITLLNDEFVSVSGPLFDTRAYSQFKHGSNGPCKGYAQQLGHLLQAQLRPVAEVGTPIVVTGTAYKRVPNAARHVALATQRELGARGLQSAYATLYQQQISSGNYAAMTTSERESRNKTKKWTVDPADFEGKHVVVVDDIRVTGSMERSLAEFLCGLSIQGLTMAYVVRIDPAVAAQEDRVEHRLNHAWIRNLRDLMELIEEAESYTFIARAVKFILESEPNEVKWFMCAAPDHVIDELYQGAVNDAYNLMARYQSNFQIVAQEAYSRRALHPWYDVWCGETDRPGGATGSRVRRRVRSRFRLSHWLARRGL